MNKTGLNPSGFLVREQWKFDALWFLHPCYKGVLLSIEETLRVFLYL
jgi:hypothetical protein